MASSQDGEAVPISNHEAKEIKIQDAPPGREAGDDFSKEMQGGDSDLEEVKDIFQIDGEEPPDLIQKDVTSSNLFSRDEGENQEFQQLETDLVNGLKRGINVRTTKLKLKKRSKKMFKHKGQDLVEVKQRFLETLSKLVSNNTKEKALAALVKMFQSNAKDKEWLKIYLAELLNQRMTK